MKKNSVIERQTVALKLFWVVEVIRKNNRKEKMIEPQHMLVEERGLESQIKRLKVLLMGKGFEQLNSIIEELENIKFSIKSENDRILKDKLKQNS